MLLFSSGRTNKLTQGNKNTGSNLLLLTVSSRHFRKKTVLFQPLKLETNKDAV